MTVNSLKWKC